jgi:hypothetical protein
MKLTKEQILKMAQAVQENGAETYYVEQQSDGKIRFGILAVIEKQIPISLTKVGRDERETQGV